MNKRTDSQPTDESLRQQLRDALAIGMITGEEYDDAIDHLDRRYNVLGWIFVVVYLVGLLGAVAFVIAGAWAFIVFAATVAGLL